MTGWLPPHSGSGGNFGTTMPVLGAPFCGETVLSHQAALLPEVISDNRVSAVPLAQEVLSSEHLFRHVFLAEGHASFPGLPGLGSPSGVQEQNMKLTRFGQGPVADLTAGADDVFSTWHWRGCTNTWRWACIGTLVHKNKMCLKGSGVRKQKEPNVHVCCTHLAEVECFKLGFLKYLMLAAPLFLSCSGHCVSDH